MPSPTQSVGEDIKSRADEVTMTARSSDVGPMARKSSCPSFGRSYWITVLATWNFRGQLIVHAPLM